MKKFKDKVAAATGAASCIGRAKAETFAAEGMKVVLSDIEPALEETTRSFAATLQRGHFVIGMANNLNAVAKSDSIFLLARSGFGTSSNERKIL